jgi:ADP-ribose pyrophosphatase YjhB (NUDIX family)
MNWIPHLTVAAIIEDQQGFLLIEETSSNGVIVVNQPAGHWEPNETLIDAVIRETLEETAWHFKPEAIVGIYEYTSPINQNTYLRVCFSGKKLKKEVNRVLDVGIVRTVSLTRDEVAELPNLRSPMVLNCIDDYLSGVRYPLSLIKHIT